MKPSTQSIKSSTMLKSKKNSKGKERKKSQNCDVNNSTDKNSPTKEPSTRLYAGIDSGSIAVYSEQSSDEHLSEDITDLLTEDINYQLRYIIHTALIKARLLGSRGITSHNLNETFQSLSIGKIYGPPTNPEWKKELFPFENKTFYFLNDSTVNLIDIVERESVYQQPGDIILTKKWLPDMDIAVSKALRNYYTTMCQMVINKDAEVRKMALKNIGANPQIGAIIEWFYNFGYYLLSKDITYDCLTLNALDLITILENSCTCRINVSEKKLKLLVRLILQRLLISSTTIEVLKPMCSVLAILCRRRPLWQFVVLKIAQKLPEIYQNFTLPVVKSINCLGIEAICEIFLPNIMLFIMKVVDEQNQELRSTFMEIFNTMVKYNCMDSMIYYVYREIFESALVIYSKPFHDISLLNDQNKNEINFINVKIQLFKTRRKIPAKQRIKLEIKTNIINDIFDMPLENSKLGEKLDKHKWTNEKEERHVKETHITIGKTSLLLPVFKRIKITHSFPQKCYDHSLTRYNL